MEYKILRIVLLYISIMILWGFWSFLPKLAVRTVTPATALLAEVLAGITLALIVAVTWREKNTLRTAQPHRTRRFVSILAGFGAGVCGYSGIFTYINAVQTYDVHYAAIVSGLYPGLTVLLGMLFLRERLSNRQCVGITLALVAIILVAVG